MKNDTIRRMRRSVCLLLVAVAACGQPSGSEVPKCNDCQERSAPIDGGPRPRRSIFAPSSDDPDGGAERRGAEEKARLDRETKESIARADEDFANLPSSRDSGALEAEIRRKLAALGPRMEGAKVQLVECRKGGCRLRIDVPRGGDLPELSRLDVFPPRTRGGLTPHYELPDGGTAYHFYIRLDDGGADAGARRP